MKNTQNKKRKGFTIVELVIVIAVIAILAAVMIPTFGSIIETANRSADTQLVAQINTILFVEDKLGGGVNDAVEIQKIIKENGLELKTKTKGQYIWYDIENKKVVLGGLNETGIVIEGDNAPVAPKGQFVAATSPESFVDGYLFISTDSADNLADSIHALRNPKGDNPEQSLKDAIAAIKEENAVLGTNLESFMNTTAVMTENGTFCINSANKSNVDRVIVSPDMPEVTTTALEQLAGYTNVVVVDLHSGVAGIDGQKATTDLAHIFFSYNSEGIAEIDKAFGGPDNNLITLNERSDYLHSIYWVDCFYDPSTGSATISENKNLVAEIKAAIYKFNYSFDYALKAGTDSLSYDFIGYSLSTDGSRPFALGTHEYELTDAEKYRIDEDGYLTIYRVYYTATSDFKIGNAYYSSKTVTSMLAENGLAALPNGTSTITVVSTTATLGSATETNLTIPAGVELLLPFNDAKTKTSWTITAGSYSEDAYKENGAYNKAKMTGKTQLIILENVTLNLSASADGKSGGSIYVDAACYNAATSYQCFITNNCGVMELKEGSQIISSGNITAYGIIRGDGTITTKEGTVTELMTLYDWYGGTNASQAVPNHNVVPFNNWKVEHIAVEKMTINHPTQYKTQVGITVSNPLTSEIVVIPINGFVLAGPSSSAPVFVTSENTVIERSVSANGNIKFGIIAGSVTDAPKNLEIQTNFLGSSVTVDFTVIGLPISNMDIIVAPGATLTVTNNIYKIMPGSSIVVETETDENGNKVEGGKNGILNIGTEVVICNSFDMEFEPKAAESSDWSIEIYSYKDTVTFSPTEGGTIKVIKTSASKVIWDSKWNESTSEATLVLPHLNTYSDTPAKFVVNGILNFNGGAFAGNITSTISGATINVNATIYSHEIDEGYYIQSDVVDDRWYDAYDPNMHKVPMLAGTAVDGGQLTSGTTYTSNVGGVAGNQFCQWQ